MSKSIREIALDVLLRVEEEKAFSNLLLNSILNTNDISHTDRGLITEIVYGTITWRDRLDYSISQYVKGSMVKIERWVLILLRLSFYQLIYLDRVPAYAVVNEAVNISKRRGHQGISRMINGVLRSYIREPQKAEIPSEIKGKRRIALQYSHPLWLVEHFIKQYGEETTEKICRANNQPHAPSIRVNRLKADRDLLVDQLIGKEIQANPSVIAPHGVRISSGGNPSSLTEYEEGLFTIQDESSMLVAHLLNVNFGMRVLDACAAPGGKTTHIAELMSNQGEIIANDIHPHKEKLILDQAKRLGITIINTVVGDALSIPNRVEGQFDRILLDAPCTGFGVIRRKPDLKWNKTPEDIDAISKLQYQMLLSLAPMLKRGGKMIYSTCTTLQDENEKLIERFIKENPSYKLDEELVEDLPYEFLKSKVVKPGMLQILPYFWDTDGFFIARLILA